jgi:hypothetical protein
VAQSPQKPGIPRIGGQQVRDSEGVKEKHANERLDEVCGELEEELEEIKVKYEMYFLGIERMEPARRRDELKRNIARLKNAFTRNAGLRFRIQALHARYLAYERLWMRSAREKEDGTYRRDLLKARRRRIAEAKSGATKRSGPESEDVDLSDFGPEEAVAEPSSPAPDVAEAEAAEPPAPAKDPAAKRAPEVQRPAPAALSEGQMRALYDAYVEAKKRCNEDVSKLTLQAVAQSVNKQIPEIVSRYKAREVEFKVVIKDGKAILKAVPRS